MRSRYQTPHYMTSGGISELTCFIMNSMLDDTLESVPAATVMTSSKKNFTINNS